MKWSSGYPVNSLTSQNTKMETSTEKQVPLSNRSCNLPSKAVKRVDKFQQTCQPETFRVTEVAIYHLKLLKELINFNKPANQKLLTI